MDAVGALELTAVRPWVVRQAERGTHRSQALHALAQLPGPETLRALLARERSSAPEVFLSAWSAALADDQNAALALSLDLLGSHDRRLLHQAARLFLVDGGEAALAGALRLSADTRLDADLRTRTFEAVEESKDSRHLPALARFVSSARPGDEEAAAAALLALYLSLIHI